MRDRQFGWVVAIPARDEAELLSPCLRAIAGQKNIDMADVAVVIAANNCRDGTGDAARAMAPDLPFTLHVEDVELPPAIAHAGGARRHAMDRAAEYCAGNGTIVTTDADGRPDSDWLAGLRAAFTPGIAAVAGRVSSDWDELSRFPADVLEIGAQEWSYQGLSAQLDALCDPAPRDPWPNHNQTCGANAAITHTWYKAIGGLPVLRTGEDGALFREVWRRDGVIRHDPAPHVTVSARLEGRAQGGMADALTSRHGNGYLCDDLLEPAADLERRSLWRNAARRAFDAGSLSEWARGQGAEPSLARAAGQQFHFGEAWLSLEAGWPLLEKRRIAARDIGSELAVIRRLVLKHGGQQLSEW
jgi:glycosyltransferase involved in cell wall biosynthesis